MHALAIRDIINNNKLYVWLLVVVLLINSYVSLSPLFSTAKKDITKTVSGFTQEMEKNKQLLEKALKENPKAAANFARLSFLIFLALLLSFALFIKYLLMKINREEPIPRTQEDIVPAWSWSDAVRIIIIFVFFTHIFLLFQYILVKFLGYNVSDKRFSMVIDTFFMDIFILLLIIRFVAVKYKQKIEALGISFKNILKNITIAVVGYLSFIPILLGLLLLVLFIANTLHYTPPEEPIYELIFKEQRPYLLIIISAMASFVGPVVEEVFFRGFIYPAVKKRLNVALAIFITGLIFSLLHTNIVGFLPILALGMFLAYLREKTGSLIPSITVHIMHNTFLIFTMFLVKRTIGLA